VWIAHQGKLGPDRVPTGLGGGAISKLVLQSTTFGVIPLEHVAPYMRDLRFYVEASIGSDELTGVPVDLAFDNHRNLGALENYATAFSPGTPAPVNGKSLARAGMPRAANGIANTNEPRFLFAAVPDSSEGPGAVDVVQIATLRRFDTNAFVDGVQSIPAGGARVVMDYFRL
jgi:hypothetical protein